MTTNYSIEFMIQNGERFARKCDHCNKPTNEVYVINDGEEYYCSDDCLHEHYTPKQWKKMYNNDEGYWTSFYDNLDGDIAECDVEFILFDGQLIQL